MLMIRGGADEQPADRRRRRRRRARWCVRPAQDCERRGGSRRRCRRAQRRRRAPTRRSARSTTAGRRSVPQTDATTAMSRPSARSRARPSAITGGERPGRIRVRAVAEHDVEQEDRVLRIGEHGRNALGPQRRIDHRMRPSAGVAIVSEVDHLVAARSHDSNRRRARPRRSAAPRSAAASAASDPPVYSALIQRCSGRRLTSRAPAGPASATATRAASSSVRA